MIRKKTLETLLFATWALPSCSLSSQWERGPDVPLPRGGYYAGVLQNGIVLAGGTYWEEGQKKWTNRVDFFDSEAGQWTEWKSLPLPLAYGGTVSPQDGTFYLLGGVNRDTPCQEIYMWSETEWVDIGQMPSHLLYTAAVAVENKIYVLGGSRSIDDLTQVASEAWALDLNTGNWEALAPLPGPPRAVHTAAVVGKSIYVFGGCTQAAGQPLTNLSSVLRFDTLNGAWERLSDTPVAARAWWAEVVEDSIFLFGGAADDFLETVYRYDVQSDKYALVSHLPLALADTKFFFLRGRFFGISGEDRPRSRFPGLLIGEIQWRGRSNG